MVSHRFAAALALVAASIAPSGSDAEDACAIVANELRAGSADSASDRVPAGLVLPSLAAERPSLVKLDASPAGDPNALLRRDDVSPELRSDAAGMFGPLNQASSVELLGDSGAGAIGGTSGSLACQHYVFFDASGATIRAVPTPPGMSFGEAAVCGQDDRAWVGTIGSIPVVSEEFDQKSGARVDITIAPWQDHRWGRPCVVRATFSHAMSVADAQCAKGVDCGQAGAIAADLARRALAGDQRNDSGRVRLAEDGSEALLPSFDGQQRSWEIAGGRIVLLPEFGTGNYAIVGEGITGSAYWPGYVVAIWHQDGGGERPLAGVSVIEGRGRLSDVSISTPPS